MSQPRRQHFVPEGYLAGFTPAQTKADYLWIYDIERDDARRQKPREVGHERDYYRIEDPEEGHDPLSIERLLATFEGQTLPALRRVEERRELVELELLLDFVALMVVRVPRGWELARRAHAELGQHFAEMLTTDPETLRTKLEADGHGSSPEALERLARAFADGEIRVEATQDSLLRSMLVSAQSLAPLLRERHWELVLADNATPFLTCDAPVGLFLASHAQGGPPREFGFGHHLTIASFPLTRKVALVGAYERELVQGLSPSLVNAMTLNSARRFIAGPSQDFKFRHKGRDAGFSDCRAIYRALMRRRRKWAKQAQPST